MDDHDALPDPEEDPDVGAAGPRMRSAASAAVAVQQRLAAVAVGADHGAAHEAQRRGLTLPRHGVGAREVCREVHQVRVVSGQRHQAVLPLRLQVNKVREVLNAQLQLTFLVRLDKGKKFLEDLDGMDFL